MSEHAQNFRDALVIRQVRGFQRTEVCAPSRFGARGVFVLAFILALLLAVQAAVRADTISLRTGERVVGKVVAEEPAKIIFDSEGLGRVEIPRENILRIERDAPPPSPTAPPAAKTKLPAPASTNQPSAWSPSAPTVDDSDWIQLKSGEWLKGKIKAMEQKKLEFDSEKLDLQKFDWDDIKQVRSARLKSVFYGENTTVDGKLSTEGGDLVVTGQEEVRIPLRDVSRISATGPHELDHWSGKLSLGVDLKRGNTDLTEVDTTFELRRRTPRTRLSLDYRGSYQALNGVESVNSHRASSGLDLLLTRRWFVRPAYGEYVRDPFQNIGYRVTGAVAAGYYLYDRPGLEWFVAGGPAYQHTKFETVEAGAAPSSSTPAGLFFTRFEKELTKRIDFIQYYQAALASREAGTFIHHSVTTLEIDLKKNFDLDLSFIWDRTQNPHQQSDGGFPKQDDFRLTVGLGFRF